MSLAKSDKCKNENKTKARGLKGRGNFESLKVALLCILLLAFFVPFLSAQSNESQTSPFITIYDSTNLTSEYDPNVTRQCKLNESACQPNQPDGGLSLLTMGFDVLANAIGFIVSKLIQPMMKIVLKPVMGTFFHLFAIFPNLQTYDLKCNYNKMYSLAASLYSLALVIIGLYWVFGATNTNVRTQAKEYTELFILLILAETVAPHLFQLLIDLSLSLTAKFLEKPLSDITPIVEELINAFVEIGAFVFFLPAAAILFTALAALILLTAVLIILRNMMISIMFILLPLTVFFYLIPLTRRIGSGLLKYTIALVFSPLILGIVLYMVVEVRSSAGVVAYPILSIIYIMAVFYIFYKILSTIVIGGLESALSDIAGGVASFPGATMIPSALQMYKGTRSLFGEKMRDVRDWGRARIEGKVKPELRRTWQSVQTTAKQKLEEWKEKRFLGDVYKQRQSKK